MRVHYAVIGAVNIRAVKDVIARTATNAIGTCSACKSIITRAPVNDIIARARINRVIF